MNCIHCGEPINIVIRGGVAWAKYGHLHGYYRCDKRVFTLGDNLNKTATPADLNLYLEEALKIPKEPS